MFIDLICVLFLIYGAVSGFFKGSVRAILGVLSILLGIFIALKLGPFLGEFIGRSFRTGEMLSLILGVVLCFVLVYWGIRLFASSLHKRLKTSKLNFLNKILGAVIMSALMLLIYSSILWFMDETYLLSDQAKAESESYSYLREIPGKSKEVFHKLEPFFKAFSEKIDSIRAGSESQQ